MNTGQLEHALRTNQLTSKLFRAVVAADRLPTSANQQGSYVVNTDPHYLPGQHWVVLHFTSSHIVYFDPMGAPIAKHLLDRLRSSGTFSEKTLQHFDTHADSTALTTSCVWPTQNCTNWTSLVTI